jgi:hypothetical protein
MFSRVLFPFSFFFFLPVKLQVASVKKLLYWFF